MEKDTFNIDEKRKILYKRKQKRKFILRVNFLLFLFFILSLTLIFTMKQDDKKIAVKKIATDEKKYIVCIDPGHGDWDIGAKGENGTMEKDIVLNVSLKLGKLLEENEIKVVYTRTNDSLPWLSTANDSLKERINIPKVFKADLFISIHCNSNEASKESKGVESWYKPNSKDGEMLADLIQKELANINYTVDRGLKSYGKPEDALAVLELNTATSTLIELGFLSNIQDEKFLSSEKGQANCALAIYNGILKYKEIYSNKSIENLSNHQ
ncbi:hypothetical protein JCM1393_23620 [Clostridium carnis]